AVLVRTFKPGDEVKLSLIRAGKPQTVSAKLVEKELPVLDDGSPWGAPFGEWPVPRFDADFEILPLFKDGRLDRRVEADGSSSVGWSDNVHSLQLTVK